MTYDEDQVIMVAVPSSYFGASCGLCGNFNEDTDDEAMVPNGIPGEGGEDWAESWRDPSCQEHCGDQETAQGTEGCGEFMWGSVNILGKGAEDPCENSAVGITPEQWL